MHQKPHRTTVIYTVLICGATWFRVAEAQPPERVAFTIQKTETPYHRQSGKPGLSIVSTFAIQRDGSTALVRERATPDGKAYRVAGVLDVPNRRSVTFDTLTQSITTSNMSSDHISAVTAIPAQCKVDSPLQSSTRLGVQVLKFTHDIPSSQPGEVYTMESWVAPSLNCYPLQETLHIAAPDGSSLPMFVREVTFLTVGEPDPQLFVIPEGMTERPPSVVLAEHRKFFQ